MAFSGVIICESDGRWALGLRRALANAALRLRECRRWADCEAELQQAADRLVLIEWLADRRAATAQFMDRLGRRYPAAAVVALADDPAPGDEWLAREAGAVHFVAGWEQLESAAQLVRRQAPRALAVEPELPRHLWQTLLLDNSQGSIDA